MKDATHKISVITINYNNARGLNDTINSVISQSVLPYEYIVIDGGSEDGSTEIIKSHQAHISYWLSEKDNGIYNAMNKGIMKATGDYLLFLNSGDCFFETNSHKLLNDASFHEDIIYWDQKNMVTSEVIKYPEKLSFYFFFTTTLNHQSTLIHRLLFEKQGLYNEASKIVADWEFYIQAIYLHGASTKKLKGFYTQYDYSEGISNSPDMYKQLLFERENVLQKYFPGFINDNRELEKYRKLIYKLSIGKRAKNFARRLILGFNRGKNGK